MKKTSLVFLLWITPSIIFAQGQKTWGDPSIVEKFSELTSKNAAYKKLKGELSKLTNQSSRTQTNAQAVKTLVRQNASLLNDLYKKSGLGTPRSLSSKEPKALNKTFIPTSQLKPKIMLRDPFVKVKLPPFQKPWYTMDQGGYYNVLPDTSDSDYSKGKIVFMFGPPPGVQVRLGEYIRGYEQTFTIPSNPEIIAAQIKFEYSFFYTGWDTYGAVTGFDMVLGFKKEDIFTGPAINDLPPYSFSYSYGNDIWKHAAVLYARDTVESDFEEFHRSVNSTYAIEGYVIPGSTITFRIGYGYPVDTDRAQLGCYHYSEFILKKITITYFKAGK